MQKMSDTRCRTFPGVGHLSDISFFGVVKKFKFQFYLRVDEKEHRNLSESHLAL